MASHGILKRTQMRVSSPEREHHGAAPALSSYARVADGELRGAFEGALEGAGLPVSAPAAGKVFAGVCPGSPTLCADAPQDLSSADVDPPRRPSKDSLASEGSCSTASTADLVLSNVDCDKLSLATGRRSSLLQRRGRKPSKVSLPNAKQDYRQALGDDGYDVGSMLGRSRVNRGFSVVVARKGGQSFAAKGTDECDSIGIFAATLRREFDILRHLSHPGLVSAEAFVSASGGCAMVMELCPGVCLEQLMPKGSALCAHGRHAVLQQILDAAAYLHSQYVAHRDLHALNVMVEARVGGATGTPSVKIIDFGSARQQEALEEGAGEFSELEDLTADILPPESAARASTLDCDVFAIGLLAVGLFVGRPVLTAHVFTSEAASAPQVPECFVELSSAGKHHLHSMLALECRPTAHDCQTSLPPCDQWLA